MLTFSFSYHKSTLLENKYDINLITLTSMYHLPLVSLHVQLTLNRPGFLESSTAGGGADSAPPV